MKTIQIAPVRKSVLVDSSPDQAFEIFTAGIDRWWPKTHGIGPTPVRESIIEPHVGGRWLTRHEGGEEVVVGHVLAWDPGQRFLVTWEVSAVWKPDPRPTFTSEVEVKFSPHSSGRTLVELEHRNFERMGDEPGRKMREGVDGGWPTLLDLFAKAVAGARSGAHV